MVTMAAKLVAVDCQGFLSRGRRDGTAKSRRGRGRTRGRGRIGVGRGRIGVGMGGNPPLLPSPMAPWTVPGPRARRPSPNPWYGQRLRRVRRPLGGAACPAGWIALAPERPLPTGPACPSQCPWTVQALVQGWLHLPTCQGRGTGLGPRLGLGCPQEVPGPGAAAAVGAPEQPPRGLVDPPHPPRPPPPPCPRPHPSWVQALGVCPRVRGWRCQLALSRGLGVEVEVVGVGVVLVEVVQVVVVVVVLLLLSSGPRAWQLLRVGWPLAPPGPGLGCPCCQS